MNRCSENPINVGTVDRSAEGGGPPIIKEADLYRNPVSSLFSIVASVIFWMVYWIAQIIIFGTGIAIIIYFIFPRYASYLVNHMMGQYEIENKFKDEL